MIVGKLTQEEAGNSHLLAPKELEKTNHKTIVNFVDDSLSKSVKFNIFFLILNALSR
jgi:ribosomal protein L35